MSYVLCPVFYVLSYQPVVSLVVPSWWAILCANTSGPFGGSKLVVHLVGSRVIKSMGHLCTKVGNPFGDPTLVVHLVVHVVVHPIIKLVGHFVFESCCFSGGLKMLGHLVYQTWLSFGP